MRKQYAILAIFLILSLLILIFRDSLPAKFFISSIQSIFSSPKAILYSFKTNVSGNDSEELAKLKAENAALIRKLLDFEKIKRDNEALRSQFEEATSKSFKILPGRIIGFLGRFTSPSELVINVGEENGVKRGMAVILGTNLVGKIDLVSDNYSRVILPANAGFSEVAKTAENGSLGVIQGQRDFILLSQVSIKDKILPGEVVLTRGEGDDVENLVPAGLVIGKISSLYKNESMPYQTAKVVSEVPILKLETVFVVLGY